MRMNYISGLKLIILIRIIYVHAITILKLFRGDRIAKRDLTQGTIPSLLLSKF